MSVHNNNNNVGIPTLQGLRIKLRDQEVIMKVIRAKRAEMETLTAEPSINTALKGRPNCDKGRNLRAFMVRRQMLKLSQGRDCGSVGRSVKYGKVR